MIASFAGMNTGGPMVTSWVGTTVRLPFVDGHGYEYNVMVDWGDGGQLARISTADVSTRRKETTTHTYVDGKDVHEVRIYGHVPAWDFSTLGQHDRIHGGPEEPPSLDFVWSTSGQKEEKDLYFLHRIDDWGDARLGRRHVTEGALSFCPLLFHVAEPPDLRGSVRQMFQGAVHFNQDIGDWDVSKVTNMYGMFKDTSMFNQDIGRWDVSGVKDMSKMFERASRFNQDIGRWDVSGVTDMASMFMQSHEFDRDIGGWQVHNVTDMSSMFAATDNFNQDIGGWTVHNVTDMNHMFHFAEKFNQDIGGWQVHNVINMRGMFRCTHVFNQDIGGWQVHRVTDMGHLFSGAIQFNQDIGHWNVQNVTDMEGMFLSAEKFNQDISRWDVRNVQDMSEMFAGAMTRFQHDLGNWSIGIDTNTREMFGRLR